MSAEKWEKVCDSYSRYTSKTLFAARTLRKESIIWKRNNQLFFPAANEFRIFSRLCQAASAISSCTVCFFQKQINDPITSTVNLLMKSKYFLLCSPLYIFFFPQLFLIFFLFRLLLFPAFHVSFSSLYRFTHLSLLCSGIYCESCLDAVSEHKLNLRVDDITCERIYKLVEYFRMVVDVTARTKLKEWRWGSRNEKWWGKREERERGRRGQGTQLMRKYMLSSMCRKGYEKTDKHDRRHTGS